MGRWQDIKESLLRGFADATLDFAGGGGGVSIAELIQTAQSSAEKMAESIIGAIGKQLAKHHGHELIVERHGEQAVLWCKTCEWPVLRGTWTVTIITERGQIVGEARG